MCVVQFAISMLSAEYVNCVIYRSTRYRGSPNQLVSLGLSLVFLFVYRLYPATLSPTYSADANDCTVISLHFNPHFEMRERELCSRIDLYFLRNDLTSYFDSVGSTLT